MSFSLPPPPPRARANSHTTIPPIPQADTPDTTRREELDAEEEMEEEAPALGRAAADTLPNSRTRGCGMEVEEEVEA